MDNEYESINLASTLKSELKAKSPRNHAQNQQQVPVSESESYDDDEFEHDPEDFITNKHGDLQEHILHPSDQSDANLADSDNTLKLGLLHLSELVPPLNNQNFNEPIQYLSGRISTFERQLVEHTQNYNTLLNDGNSNVTEIRSAILQIFHLLSECYFSLNELYSKDVSYTKSVNTYFNTWNLKRDRVLQKIQKAKSIESAHGAKLAELLNESVVVDDEIGDLQRRIAVLQKKKSVLNKEIEDTTSVLESRTATYGENLRYLELNGREILLDYLSHNGLPESELATLVKEQTIDLSFTMPEKVNSDSETKLEYSISQPKANNNIGAVSENDAETSIGMKPYEPPPVATSTIMRQNTPPPHNESLMNHEHGPTAFEKGYATGAQNSRLLKNQVQGFFHKVILHVPRRNETPQFKPNSNTATTLDVGPITTFLRLRVEALNDQVINTSKTSALYHECNKQWAQIQQLMTSQEEKLEQILKGSKADGDDTPVLHVLTQTRDQLELAAKLISDMDSLEILLQLVNHEITAITEAILLVSKEGHNLGSKQLKQS